jgi:hypothetical protein
MELELDNRVAAPSLGVDIPDVVSRDEVDAEE